MSDSTRDRLSELLEERILVVDGAMGTMIQARGLAPADFHGERFAEHPTELTGDNDGELFDPAESIGESVFSEALSTKASSLDALVDELEEDPRLSSVVDDADEEPVVSGSSSVADQVRQLAEPEEQDGRQPGRRHQLEARGQVELREAVVLGRLQQLPAPGRQPIELLLAPLAHLEDSAAHQWRERVALPLAGPAARVVVALETGDAVCRAVREQAMNCSTADRHLSGSVGCSL